MTRARGMVAVSAREWDGVESRPHHFMRLCALAGWRVLYVEPPASLIAPLKNRNVIGRWRRWLQGVRPVEPGVSVLAPPPVLPFGNRRRRINRINQRLIARRVKRALRDLEIDDTETDVYTFLPSSVDLLPHLPHRRLIYDCVDDHAAFKGLVDPVTVRQMEGELMARAGVCFASAQALRDQKRNWSSNLHLIPNGCDFEHFAIAAQRSVLPIPSELREIFANHGSRHAGRVAGFIGGLGDWVDQELLAAVACRLPDVAFVFIGPIMVRRATLGRLPNVHLLGPRPYRDLPRFLRHFAVCLIPFHLQELTLAVNPIKLFEYLAAGKPIVSTPLPEVVPFGNVVSIAKDVGETVDAIEAAISSAEDPDLVRARQAIARESAWGSRWECALHHIRSIEG